MNHDSAFKAEELALGKMFHEENIVATQELAMGIVATQELAMATEMFHEDMESLVGLNQSLTVFAASGNESCWSQESTAS
jgi:hypothetical protein